MLTEDTNRTRKNMPKGTQFDYQNPCPGRAFLSPEPPGRKLKERDNQHPHGRPGEPGPGEGPAGRDPPWRRKCFESASGSWVPGIYRYNLDKYITYFQHTHKLCTTYTQNPHHNGYKHRVEMLSPVLPNTTSTAR